MGGAVSGPLVVLIGLQMLFCLRRPWLPGFIARRGPKRGTHRFLTASTARCGAWTRCRNPACRNC
jgi:hypothetical protein